LHSIPIKDRVLTNANNRVNIQNLRNLRVGTVMNSNEQDKVFRLSQVSPARESSRQNIQLLFELKARQVELEDQIEDLRQAETLLRQTTKHFADFYEYSPIAFVSLSPRGFIQEHNKKFSQQLETSRINCVGRSFADYLVEDDIETFRQHLLDVLSTQDSVSCRVNLRSGSGRISRVELTSVAWYEATHGGTIIRSSIHSLSDLDRAEKKLKEELEQALAASVAKTEFLSNMSHEIRTPLGVIIGYADLLLEHPNAPEVTNGLGIIYRNSNHLLNLVDDLLDLSKVEAGKLTIEHLPFLVDHEMEVIVGQFQRRAQAKGVSLNLRQLTPLPLHLYTDPIRFRQIVLNVLGNALKFTEAGSIDVEVSYGKVVSSAQKKLICIDIHDTGRGMSQEEALNIFEPFTQATCSTSRQYGGTGLGLSISRRFALALGGDVSLLYSKENEGSAFRITIDPHNGNSENVTVLTSSGIPAPTELKPDRSLPSLDGIRILVIEDGLDNQALIKKLLENVGAEVVLAEDGELGIDHAMSESFHVVLMDIGLPGIDGYDAMSELRRLGYRVPIIALTAHALDADRRRAEALGFDDFISKPIDWPKLAEAIVRCRDAYIH
jgi:PAS domain S-box-containing protein